MKLSFQINIKANNFKFLDLNFMQRSLPKMTSEGGPNDFGRRTKRSKRILKKIKNEKDNFHIKDFFKKLKNEFAKLKMDKSL